MERRVQSGIGGLLAAVVIVVGVAVVLSGCAVFGVDKAKQLQANLANQRKVAVKLMEDYPNPELETIRYTRPGSVDGSGSWAANAVITVAGNDYKGIYGTLTSAGEGLPPITSDASPGAVTLIFSDGTSEVLE